MAPVSKGYAGRESGFYSAQTTPTIQCAGHHGRNIFCYDEPSSQRQANLSSSIETHETAKRPICDGNSTLFFK